MIPENAKILLNELDGSGSDKEWKAIENLRSFKDKLPSFLLEHYLTQKKWKTRCACVYNAMRYARENEDAFQLGLIALNDKSKIVRYQGCELLAWSLRVEAITQLKKLLRCELEKNTREAALAAIDAIENQNSNYFVDRDHSGMVTLNVL